MADCSNFLSPTEVAFPDVGAILNVFATTIIIIAGLFSFVGLALGGFQYVTSGGDKALVEQARLRITYAILGLAIVATAVAVSQILGRVFGINIFGIITWPGAVNIIGENPTACP